MVGSKKLVITCLDCGKKFDHKAQLEKEKAKDDWDKINQEWEKLFRSFKK
jgi:hypothetical protein